jgi:hypothetical protein
MAVKGGGSINGTTLGVGVAVGGGHPVGTHVGVGVGDGPGVIVVIGPAVAGNHTIVGVEVGVCANATAANKNPSSNRIVLFI